MTATRKWSLLAVLLVAAIFAASWYLLIAPKRSEAAGLRSQTVEQDAATERLRQQLEVLKAQAQDLPKQEAFLAQIRRQVPDNPALPAVIRDLSAAAKKSGVELVSLAPGLPVAVVSPVLAPAVVAPTAGTTAAPSTTTTVAAAPVAPAPTLFQVPLVVKTSGDYFEIEQFLNRLEGLKRSFLVTGFTLSPASEGGLEGTSSDGSLNLDIQGRVFLSPAAAAVVSTVPGAVPAPVVTSTVPAPAATVTTPAPSTAPAAN
jgi:type IV pilus assembly protein PilO